MSYAFIVHRLARLCVRLLARVLRRHLKVAVNPLQVVLAGDAGRVTQPRAHDVIGR